jgi:aminoglycoside phosphotransferase family enzyme
MPDHAELAPDRLPSLREKVDFLKRAASYPEPTARVELVETHMSWVFLTERYAYKLKKPVRREFLDFSTLEARRRNCDEEVRLNRRLAPQVYIGAAPLTIGRDRALQLEGLGVPVDWLVKMHRLPADSMLDRAIKAGRAEPSRVLAAANYLARFYVGLTPVKMRETDVLERFIAETRSQERELAKSEFRMPKRLVRRVTAGQWRFLRDRAGLLGERVRAGRIVEGHGDLRPEHICLCDPPVVIDCLEFNPTFRTLDPAEELAFLWMECEFLGAPEIGAVFWETYVGLSGDRPHHDLLGFYKCHRALLRAKLALWHFPDCRAGEREKWRAQALSYLELAAAAQPSSNSTIDPPV